MLENAACEPEVADVASCLNKMGAKIEGAGTSTIVIQGVDCLEGATHTVLPDRIETGTYAMAVAATGGDVYLDGAHNPGAARELAHFLEQNFANRKIWLIYGALRDKAVDEVAGLLFPHAAEVIFTAPNTSRAVSAAQLAEIAGHHAAHFSVIPDAERAFEHALAQAAPEDAIFITGSLYLVGQLRHYWKTKTQVHSR